MTTQPQPPITVADLPAVAARHDEFVLARLADAVAELREDHPVIVGLWGIVDERAISSAEFSEKLNADARIDWAHPTTWNRRKNKALGKPNYRDINASIQRRRKPDPEHPETHSA